jgi:hypothetical protein
MLTRLSGRIRLAVLGLIVGLFVPTARAQADDLTAVPPTTPELRAYYSLLQQNWWNWAASIKANKHPFNDPTGENADQGQQGDVWFIGGIFGEPVDETTVIGTADRLCTVPAGKAIFFPVLNTLFSNLGEDPPLSDAELEAAAAFYNGPATDLAVRLDGHDVASVKQRFETESGAFTLNYTANGIFGTKPGTTRAADAGYYVLLAPPSPGVHDLEFQGAYVYTSEEYGFDFVFALDIHYTLIVAEE